MDIAERFGGNLRRIRKRSGLSQEALAMRASLHRTHIGLLERAERMPRVDTVVKLAGALGVEAEDLLAGMVWTPGKTLPGEFKPPPELPCDDA